MRSEHTLLQLVEHAQQGDKDAFITIIKKVSPALHSIKRKAKLDRQDDVEQQIIEMLLRKIMDFNLNSTPNFSQFLAIKGKPEDEEHRIEMQ